ncbi:hypothetical protein [Bacillus piscicola]|uniref:hypothetical protein n=1 Tax=Bacillus piscicola TaxID=1632684 RepID=UPI001F09ADA1|nr:hypothetical protein [Bacillus piscicola]
MTELNLPNKPLPNDKRDLLKTRNFEMYNLDLMRKVFPRIIGECNERHGRKQRKPQIRDVIPLYFYLLSYVNGEYDRADGSADKWFGAAFPTLDQISQSLDIDRRRIKPLVDILEANGLILRTESIYVETRRYKHYYMSFCPQITDTGYLVDEWGEIVRPDPAVYDSA